MSDLVNRAAGIGVRFYDPDECVGNIANRERVESLDLVRMHPESNVGMLSGDQGPARIFTRVYFDDGFYCAWVEIDQDTWMRYAEARQLDARGDSSAYASLTFTGKMGNRIPELGLELGAEVSCAVLDPAHLPAGVSVA